MGLIWDTHECQVVHLKDTLKPIDGFHWSVEYGICFMEMERYLSLPKFNSLLKSATSYLDEAESYCMPCLYRLKWSSYPNYVYTYDTYTILYYMYIYICIYIYRSTHVYIYIVVSIPIMPPYFQLRRIPGFIGCPITPSPGRRRVTVLPVDGIARYCQHLSVFFQASAMWGYGW